MMINLTMTYNPDAFAFSEAGVLANGVSRISEFQYFALVTLTTLGYGEITPITPAARSIASLISVSGQLYVAIVIALLVGKFSGQSKKGNK
jgi:voltage-gated potassium channel Kch